MHFFPNFETVCCSVASWPAYRFLRRQVRWSSISISLRVFQFVMTHTIKGFHVVNEEELHLFLEFLCFLYDPVNVGNLISGSSAFFFNPAWISGSSWFMYSWSLAWKILSITLLECEKTAIVQWFEHLLVLLFLGTGMKIDLPSYGHCSVFHIC